MRVQTGHGDVCDFQLCSLSVSNEVWRGKLSQILSSVFSLSIPNQQANSIPNHRANSIQPRGAPAQRSTNENPANGPRGITASTQSCCKKEAEILFLYCLTIWVRSCCSCVADKELLVKLFQTVTATLVHQRDANDREARTKNDKRKALVSVCWGPSSVTRCRTRWHLHSGVSELWCRHKSPSLTHTE